MSAGAACAWPMHAGQPVCGERHHGRAGLGPGRRLCLPHPREQAARLGQQPGAKGGGRSGAAAPCMALPSCPARHRRSGRRRRVGSMRGRAKSAAPLELLSSRLATLPPLLAPGPVRLRSCPANASPLTPPPPPPCRSLTLPLSPRPRATPSTCSAAPTPRLTGQSSSEAPTDLGRRRAGRVASRAQGRLWLACSSTKQAPAELCAPPIPPSMHPTPVPCPAHTPALPPPAAGLHGWIRCRQAPACSAGR